MQLKKFTFLNIPDLTGNPKLMLFIILSEPIVQRTKLLRVPHYGQGKSPIPSTLIAIQPECPQVIFQDLKEVHDHGEGKVNICLVKKCGLMRIMFLLGLFMITIFMWKFLFKTASLYLPPLSRIQL